MTLEDTHLSSDALINVSTSCGKCLIDCDLCEVRTGMYPWCWPLHLQLPDRYLRYHLWSLLLQRTVILNGQDCSLVAGRHVDISFLFWWRCAAEKISTNHGCVAYISFLWCRPAFTFNTWCTMRILNICTKLLNRVCIEHTWSRTWYTFVFAIKPKLDRHITVRINEIQYV